MNDSAQNNQQPNSVPVDTSMGDGMSAPPFPIGGADTSQSPAQPIQNTINTQGSGAPIIPSPVSEPVVADATAGNQPTVAAAPPPPGDGQTITTFKPVRGKFGPKGVVATIFGIIVLVAATVVGITQVGQQQLFQQKAGRDCTAELNSCLATCTDEATKQTCEDSCRTASDQCIAETTSEQPAQTSEDQVLRCNGDSIGNQCSGSHLPGFQCNGSDGKHYVCQSTGEFVESIAGDPGEPNSCASWYKFYCRDKFGLGDGCSENRSGPFTTQPDFDASFCGTQQIDCATGDINETGFVSREDRSACANSSEAPANNCESNGGTCYQLGVPISNYFPDDTSGNVVQNCGSFAQQTNPGSCGAGFVCCIGGGGEPKGGKAKCGGVGLQLNGQYTKSNGRVANGWHTATLSEVQALQAGDTVRLTVKAGAASGANNPGWTDFTKGRFSINGGAFIETTTYTNLENDRIGIFGRIFQYDYVIPAGVTDFNIQGQIYYQRGQNPGWL